MGTGIDPKAPNRVEVFNYWYLMVSGKKNTNKSLKNYYRKTLKKVGFFHCLIRNFFYLIDY